jgi:hypothetical protein
MLNLQGKTVFINQKLFKMEKLVIEIKAKMDAMVKDLDKAIAGNKAAAARARKSSNDLTKMYKEFRKVSVQEGK